MIIFAWQKIEGIKEKVQEQKLQCCKDRLVKSTTFVLNISERHPKKKKIKSPVRKIETNVLPNEMRIYRANI